MKHQLNNNSFLNAKHQEKTRTPHKKQQLFESLKLNETQGKP